MQSKIVFREMLSELKALADVQGNYLTKEDIKKFFPGDALNDKQVCHAEESSGSLSHQ